jgi:hypothetical protein
MRDWGWPQEGPDMHLELAIRFELRGPVAAFRTWSRDLELSDYGRFDGPYGHPNVVAYFFVHEHYDELVAQALHGTGISHAHHIHQIGVTTEAAWLSRFWGDKRCQGSDAHFLEALLGYDLFIKGWTLRDEDYGVEYTSGRDRPSLLAHLDASA